MNNIVKYKNILKTNNKITNPCIWHEFTNYNALADPQWITNGVPSTFDISYYLVLITVTKQSSSLTTATKLETRFVSVSVHDPMKLVSRKTFHEIGFSNAHRA